MSSHATGQPGLSYAAHLRVYEPLAGFAPTEREHWRRYTEDGGATHPIVAVARERAAAVAALLNTPPGLPAGDPVEALVRWHGDGPYVCPLRTQVRAWQALGEFRAGLPEELATAFVPAPMAEAAQEALERWLASSSGRRSHVLTSGWQVPLAWFVLARPRERQLVRGPRSRTGRLPALACERQRRLTYLVAMPDARRRVASALAVLRRTVEGPAVASVEDLGRWLEEFHPRALVELDYGGLVHLLADDELAGDDSPAVLAEGLRALADGDTASAGAAYERVVERWRRLSALEHAS